MNVRRIFSAASLRLALAGFAASAAVAACSSGSSDPGTGSSANTSCKAGTTVACTCADGTTGSQTCGATSCTCGASNGGIDASTGTTGHDAGTGTGPGTGNGNGDGDGGHLHDSGPPTTDAAPGTYGATCTTDKDCTDPVYNACFVGGQRSMCTKKCATGADCPSPPTTGTCNKQLYCK